jgi:RNA polymerase sigma-70 factor (ECF subfamily)
VEQGGLRRGIFLSFVGKKEQPDPPASAFMNMEEHKTVENEAVLPRAKMGDEAALKVIYDRHFSPVFRTALRYTGSVEDSEEIAQETFVKVFRNLGRVWSRDTESLGPWIGRICVNNSISFLRRGKRLGRGLLLPLDELLPEPASQEASPETSLLVTQAWALLDQALTRLSPQQRMIFDLRFRQHKDIKEIADLLGCSESNVKTHVKRLLAKLRRRLAPLWEAP